MMVKVMESVILRLDMSPSEVREAAMYACYRCEMMNPRPLMVEMKREEFEVYEHCRRAMGLGP